MAIAHKQPDWKRDPEADLDIDQLFLPEPEPRAEPLRVIFTQPSDRDIQFADEPTAFVEERPQAAAPPVAPAIQPNRRPLNRGEASGKGLLRLFQTAAGLVVAVALLFLLIMPNGGRRAEAPSSPRRVAAPPEPAVPPVANPSIPSAPVQREVQPAPTPEPAVSARPAPAPQPNELRSPAIVDALPPVRPSSPLGRVTAAPPAPQPTTVPGGETTAARSGTARPDDTARPAPALELRQLDTDAGAVLGQPLAPPPADVPPIVAARERGLLPRDEPSATTAPTGTAGTGSIDLRGVERDKVRAVLSGYERAYSQLDAAAAATLYPTLDNKALTRAFNSLSAQQVRFEECRIQVQQFTAQATCAGTASWTPKVGGGSRNQARHWQFDLRQVAGSWQIGSVKVQ